MALTRANAELLLVARTSAWLLKASMAITVLGSNADLNDPIAYGVLQSGGTVASRVLVTTADIATVASADQEQFLDIAELRTFQNIQGNLVQVDTKIGPRDEKLGQLLATLDKIVERKEERVENLYGLGLGTIEGGVIALDFAEHDQDNVDELGW